MTVCTDWLRIYMLLTVVIVNPQVFLGVTTFFMIIAFTLLTLFRQIVFKHRPDLQACISPAVFCVYPFYKV